MATPKSKATKTVYVANAIDEKESRALYDYLQANIPWTEGIRSRKGFTRLAKSLDPEDYPELVQVVGKALKKIHSDEDASYNLLGLYLNYYSNGDMWLPNHSHAGTSQLVISLGATRTLQVAKKEYKMSNGSAIIFGSAIHGMPKEPAVKEGRISIATFMQRM